MKFLRERDNFEVNKSTSQQVNKSTSQQEAEFDSFAQEYSQELEKELSACLPGNPHEYYEQYKIFYLRKIFESQRKKSQQKLKILDYGCGIGIFAKAIFDSIPDVTIHGFDVSSKSIECVSPELQKGNNFFTSNLDELDSDYDIAMLITVLHHVVPKSERPGVMQNIYKRLKPGGKLIIIELGPS